MKLWTRAFRPLQVVLLGLALAALSLHVEGCTAIGFILGSEADLHHGTGGPALLMDIKVGRHVALRTWDAREFEGRFAGWSRDSSLAKAPVDSTSLRGRLVRLGTRKGEIRVPAVDIAEVTTSAYGATIVSTLVGFAVDVMVVRAWKSPAPRIFTPSAVRLAF